MASMIQSCTCCGDILDTRFNRRRFLHLAAGAGLVATFPSLSFAATGNYEAMLLTCIDPRFPQPTIHLHGTASPGWPIQPVHLCRRRYRRGRARLQGLGKNVLGQSRRHDPVRTQVNRVIAMNHRDCGAAKIAYGAEKVANRAHRDRDAQGRADGIPQTGRRTPAQACGRVAGSWRLKGKVERFV